MNGSLYFIYVIVKYLYRHVISVSDDDFNNNVMGVTSGAGTVDSSVA